MRIAILLTLSATLFAQMTPEQREHDFRTLAALYAKRYGPANWKIQALGVNVFDLASWLPRVRAAKDDLEYYEIASQYVTRLQDGHAFFSTPSNFVAELGLSTDLYDGKVLIQGIARARYPATAFPFQVGDELVSLDGVPVQRIMDDIARFEGWGNPASSRRRAAFFLSIRPQQIVPRAIDIPDETSAEIRLADGTLGTYTLRWTKSGLPLRTTSPVPSPFGTMSQSPEGDSPLAALRRFQNYSLDESKLSVYRLPFETENGEATDRNYILGWGARAPYFALPEGATIRRGSSAADTFFTATYTANGFRIGYLRIPNFSPSAPVSAVLRELDGEIAFFRANTDGLVVDVSRNTGGGCIGIDYAARLIPRPFTGFREQLRPTQELLNFFETELRRARLTNAPGWVVSLFEFYLGTIQEAARQNRALTGPIPACPALGQQFVVPTEWNAPARDSNGNVIAYEKPLIVLADEMSVSFGDIFPAMLQDNRRGPIVGMRTGGLGGSITSWNTQSPGPQ